MDNFSKELMTSDFITSTPIASDKGNNGIDRSNSTESLSHDSSYFTFDNSPDVSNLNSITDNEGSPSVNFDSGSELVMNTCIEGDEDPVRQIRITNVYERSSSTPFALSLSNKEKNYNTVLSCQLKRKFDVIDKQAECISSDTSFEKRKWKSRIARGVYIENIKNKIKNLSKEVKVYKKFKVDIQNVGDLSVNWDESGFSVNACNSVPLSTEYLESGNVKSTAINNIYTPKVKTLDQNESALSSTIEVIPDKTFIKDFNLTTENALNEVSNLHSVVMPISKFPDSVTHKNISNKIPEDCEAESLALAGNANDIVLEDMATCETLNMSDVQISNNLTGKVTSDKAPEEFAVESLAAADNGNNLISDDMSSETSKMPDAQTSINFNLAEKHSLNKATEEVEALADAETFNDLIAENMSNKTYVGSDTRTYNSFILSGQNTLNKKPEKCEVESLITAANVSDLILESMPSGSNRLSDSETCNNFNLYWTNSSNNTPEECEMESSAVVNIVSDEFSKNTSSKTFETSDVRTFNNFTLSELNTLNEKLENCEIESLIAAANVSDIILENLSSESLEVPDTRTSPAGENISNKTLEEYELETLEDADSLNDLISENASIAAFELSDPQTCDNFTLLAESASDEALEEYKVECLATDGSVSDTISENMSGEKFRMSDTQASTNNFNLSGKSTPNNTPEAFEIESLANASNMNDLIPENVSAESFQIYYAQTACTYNFNLTEQNISNKMPEECEVEPLATAASVNVLISENVSSKTLKIADNQSSNSSNFYRENTSNITQEECKIESLTFSNNIDDLISKHTVSNETNEVSDIQTFNNLNLSVNNIPTKAPDKCEVLSLTVATAISTDLISVNAMSTETFEISDTKASNNFNVSGEGSSNKASDKCEIEFLAAANNSNNQISKKLLNETFEISDNQTSINCNFPGENASEIVSETCEVQPSVFPKHFNLTEVKVGGKFLQMTEVGEQISQKFDYRSVLDPNNAPNCHDVNTRIMKNDIQEAPACMLINSVHDMNNSNVFNENSDKRGNPDLEHIDQISVDSEDVGEYMEICDSSSDSIASQSEPIFSVTDCSVNTSVVYCSHCKRRVYGAEMNTSVKESRANLEAINTQMESVSKPPISTLAQLFEMDSTLSRKILFGISDSGSGGICYTGILNYLRDYSVSKTTKLQQDVKHFLSAAVDAHLIHFKGKRYFIERSSLRRRVAKKAEIQKAINSKKLPQSNVNSRKRQSKTQVKKTTSEIAKITKSYQTSSKAQNSVKSVKTCALVKPTKAKQSQEMSKNRNSLKSIGTRSAVQSTKAKQTQISKTRRSAKSIGTRSAVQSTKAKQTQKLGKAQVSSRNVGPRSVTRKSIVNKSSTSQNCRRQRNSTTISAFDTVLRSGKVVRRK